MLYFLLFEKHSKYKLQKYSKLWSWEILLPFVFKFLYGNKNIYDLKQKCQSENLSLCFKKYNNKIIIFLWPKFRVMTFFISWNSETFCARKLKFHEIKTIITLWDLVAEEWNFILVYLLEPGKNFNLLIWTM